MDKTIFNWESVAAIDFILENKEVIKTLPPSFVYGFETLKVKISKLEEEHSQKQESLLRFKE